MKKVLVGLSMVISLTACSTVPKEASLLNDKVSTGIQTYQANVEQIIKQFAASQRAFKDKIWSKLYDDVQAEYIKKHNIADASKLSNYDHKYIARQTQDGFNLLVAEINEKEAALISQSKSNANALITANDEVTKYLMSLETHDESRQKVRESLSKITGIDLSSFAQQLERLSQN